MCGLSGYNGRRAPSLPVIKLLAIYNKERGTDSFGFLYDGEIEKYVYDFNKKTHGDSMKQLYGFIFNKARKDCNILMHNRSKSVGAISLANAHPFEYNTEDGPWVFAHNGTIKNIEELAIMYNEKHLVASTDSETLGFLIVKYGWKVLAHYTGAAAFSLYNKKTRALYLWRGESKWDSSQISEERPLWYYKGKDFIYYSSEALALATSLNVREDIDQIPANTVCKFEKGILTEQIEIDRSHIEWTYYTKTYDNYNTQTHNKPTVNAHTKLTSRDFSQKLYTYEEDPANIYNLGGAVYFWKGKYWRNGHPVNGTFLLDRYGRMNSNLPPEEYFFMSGYMLKDKEAYEESKIKRPNFDTAMSYDVIKLMHPSTIMIREYPNSVSLYRNREGSTSHWISDNTPQIPLFAFYSYSVVAGKMITTLISTTFTKKQTEQDIINAYADAYDGLEGYYPKKNKNKNNKRSNDLFTDPDEGNDYFNLLKQIKNQ